MIKMIFTDIDGTLVPDGSMDLNPEYYDVINKLHDKGIEVAVASGRHAGSVKKLFAPVLDKIWIISQNGGVFEKDGKSEVVSPIPAAWAREMWQDLSSFERADSIIDTESRTFCPFPGTEMYKLATDHYFYDLETTGGWEHIPEEIFSMLTVYYPDGAEEFVKRHLADKWADRLAMYTSGYLWVDFLMHGTNKGNTAKVICDRCHIHRNETIAFGDNMNDLSMLEQAGVSYTVDNARIEVQEAVDHIVPGYREDGVLKVLKGLL